LNDVDYEESVKSSHCKCQNGLKNFDTTKTKYFPYSLNINRLYVKMHFFVFECHLKTCILCLFLSFNWSRCLLESCTWPQPNRRL